MTIYAGIGVIHLRHGAEALSNAGAVPPRVKRTVIEHDHYGINGKQFFHQVIVNKILNRNVKQQPVDDWWSTFLQNDTVIVDCPPQIADFIQPLPGTQS